MGFFTKEYNIKPNTAGYLYRNNIFEQKLLAGTHQVRDWKQKTELFLLPETAKLLTVRNQEVLTKDNVALRFSFNILYRIIDGQIFLRNFTLDRPVQAIIQEAEERLYNMVQIYIRDRIAGMESETLNETRQELSDFKTPAMEQEAAQLGILIEQAQLRDITFPKSVQDLFARHLESKIRAKLELENARTAVATTRALKNASELMKDDDNIRFFKILETVTKIADKGKHIFMIGDLNQMVTKKP